MELKNGLIQIDRYEIQSMQLTRDYVAVFSDENEAGEAIAAADVVEAIGIARHEVFTIRKGERVEDVNKSNPRKYSTDNEIVSLYLDEGRWEVANEASNYIGTFRSGPELEQKLESIRDRLRREQKRKESVANGTTFTA